MKENDFLTWLAAHTPTHPAVPLPLNDDMAIVTSFLREPGTRNPEPALLKIDQCLDQVHFDLRQHTAAQAGRKAVNRCLSDCAAMAVRPAGILLSVALPKDATEAFAQELFVACRDAAAVFDCPLVGGDTAIWDQRLAITIGAMGRPEPGVAPVTRSGAVAGDAIFVSGQLGGSILGRHLTFTPRIALAIELARRVPVHAMMDLSDGLAQDLPRICRASSKPGQPIGAIVAPGQLPVHADAETLSARDGLPAALHALADGEDYELLFTIAEGDVPKLFPTLSAGQPFQIFLTRIGTITNTGKLELIDDQDQHHPWPNAGWQHHS